MAWPTLWNTDMHSIGVMGGEGPVSVWDPGFGRGTDLGCSLGALVCPFLGRLVLCGAEEGKAGHLVGKVLCAGGLVGVGSTGDTGDL